VEARVRELSALAAAEGRTLRYGVEADLVARHTREEAWQEAQREWAEAGKRTVPISPEVRATEAPPFEQSVVGEHLWRGFGQLRPGPALGLVGSYADLAETLAGYTRIGVSTLVLGAYPHLEEAYPIGEHLLPLLHTLSGTALREAV
jgi:alkanesulfonate monooxygenase